jgi:hypothetical protein
MIVTSGLQCIQVYNHQQSIGYTFESNLIFTFLKEGLGSALFIRLQELQLERLVWEQH